MKRIALLLMSLAAFGQSDTRRMIIPLQDDSATGVLGFREKYGNGIHYVGISAPDSIAATFTLKLPNAQGPAGWCLDNNGSGALGWRVCGDTYDVTSYGAVCDNSTDDTSPIQDAIDAAETAGGGTIQFPLGTCLVTTVTVSGNYIGFFGKGRNATVLKGTANQAVIHVDTTASDLYFFQVRTMTIQGNGGSFSAAIEVDGPNNFDRSTIEDVYIVDVRRGFYAHNTGSLAWLSYQSNYCDTVSVSGGTCIDISSTDGANQSVISNSMFANHTTGVGIKFTGVWFGDDAITGNNSEQGNYFLSLDCGPTCLYGANFVVTGNKIDNTAVAPCYLNNIQASTVAWNRILGGVENTCVVSGNNDQLTLDAYYANGIKNTKANESWGLGAFASGRLRLGEIDVNLSGSTNGISVKDDDESVGMALGQNSSYNVGLQWVYDATPANGYGLLYTFGNNNSMAYRAKTHSFETDGSGRWEISQTGMVLPITTDSYDIGSLTGTKRVRAIYPKIVDTALPGGTGDYVQTRKLQLFDNTGSTASAAFWDLNVVMSGVGAGQNSYFYLRDNGGVNVFKSERVIGGAAVDRTYWYTDLMPDTDAGQSLGGPTNRWQVGWMNQLGTATEPVTVYGGNSQFTALTITTAPLLIGTTTDGGTGASFMTSATNNATVFDNYSAVGANNQFRNARGSSGTPTATQSGDRLGSLTFAGMGSTVRGSPSIRIRAIAEETFTDSTKASKLCIETTATLASSSTERWCISGAGHLLASSDNSYDIGASGATRPRNVYVGSTLDVDGAVNVGGILTLSSTITGDVVPTSNNTYVLGTGSAYWNQVRSQDFYVENSGRISPTTDNTGSVGRSTARFNKGWFTDLDITGTITPPSGTAVSGTTSCGAGQAVKTITVSSGIVTGITCGTP